MTRKRSLIEVFQGQRDPSREINRLVGLGFRCGTACLRAGDSAVAAAACSMLADGVCQHGLPRSAADEFIGWCLAIECEAERPIVTLPLDAAGFSRDECLAVSLIAACQHNACPALRACAFALLGTAEAGRTLSAASELATMLAADGKRLAPGSIVDAAAVSAHAVLPDALKNPRYMN